MKTETIEALDFYKFLKDKNSKLNFFNKAFLDLELCKSVQITFKEHSYCDRIMKEYCTALFTFLKPNFFGTEIKFLLKFEPHSFDNPQIFTIQSYSIDKLKSFEKSRFSLVYHFLLGEIDFPLRKEIDFQNDIIELLNPEDWFRQNFDQIFENQSGVVLGRLKREIYFRLPDYRLVNFLRAYKYAKLSGFEHWSRRHSGTLNYSSVVERNSLKVKVTYCYYMGDNARDGEGEILVNLNDYY